VFDDDLIQASCERFFGYGSLTAPVWFIGKEEGGGGSFDEIQKRLTVWNRRGRRLLEDIRAYHEEVGMGLERLFGRSPGRQPTWAGITRMRLAFDDPEGQIADTRPVRAYRNDRLAGLTGENCLIELLPLPSPNKKAPWLYSKYSQLPFLASREARFTKFASIRAARIRWMLERHRPRAIVFYSTENDYPAHWYTIAGTPAFRSEYFEGFSAKFTRSENTAFAITPHPTRVGVTSRFLAEGREASCCAGKLTGAFTITSELRLCRVSAI
jgi:hypothetical protein